MDDRVTRADWQHYASTTLTHYQHELARHGITPGPDLHLEADERTPYSYCELTTGKISLNLPGTDRFGDLVLIMAVGSLLGTQSLADTIRCLRGLVPYLLGHELAHYLRERYGAFAVNRWVEEHAANRVGMALACTVESFTADLPFLRRLAEGARQRLPLREDQVTGALRDTHGQAVADVQAFVRLTGADELEALGAAGLEAEVLALSERQDRVAAAFNDSYMTDAMAYMRQQLAWFAQQVLEPERPRLGAVLEEHVLTASWEERLAHESAAVLARLAETPASEEALPEADVDLVALGAGPDDRQRALALERLRETGNEAGLLAVLERAAAACRLYAGLKASAALHGAPAAVQQALAEAYHLKLEAGAEAAGMLAGLPLHVVRAGLSGHTDRGEALTMGLISRRLAGPARELADSLLHPQLGAPLTADALSQALLSDPDPLVASAAGAEGRLDAETLSELPWFRGCRLLRSLLGKELLPLAEAAQEVQGAPGSVLAHRGEPPERIFLTGKGQLIGLAEALAGAPMRRAVRLPASGPLVGIAVPAFLAICREEPKLSRALAEHLARRLWRRGQPPSGGGAPGAGAAPAAARPLLPAEKALALLETDLFGGQSSRALLGIAESFITRFYPPGAVLANAGEKPRILVLLAGQIRTGAGESGPGAILGDLECLLGRPWREPITAVAETITLEADREDLLRLLYVLPDLPFHLARRLAICNILT